MDRIRPLRIGLWGLTAALLFAALYLIFIYVPTEATMGVVQRIFYFHVPAAWISLLAYVVLFAGSVLYLWKQDEKWDRVASASSEVGIVFTTVFLITGSIWAKPIWGVWWTWDPRLTTALILWFIYIAYLVVRSYATEKGRGSRFAAVVGIAGFVDIPIVALANTLWRAQHPGALVFEGGLAPPMMLTLMTGLAAFTGLYVTLLLQNIALKRTEAKIKEMRDSDFISGG